MTRPTVIESHLLFLAAAALAATLAIACGSAWASRRMAETELRQWRPDSQAIRSGPIVLRKGARIQRAELAALLRQAGLTFHEEADETRIDGQARIRWTAANDGIAALTDPAGKDAPEVQLPGVFLTSGLDPSVVSIEQIVTPDRLPGTPLERALLAAEDRQFYRHYGVLPSFMLTRYMQRGAGGSSIDQQIVKNLILMDTSRSFNRKFQELFFAAQLDARYPKADLLAIYANSVYLGSPKPGITIRGVAAAARYYFCKEPESLDIVEAATIAAIIKSPNAYLKSDPTGQLTRSRNALLTALGEATPTTPASLPGNCATEPAAPPQYFLTWARGAGVTQGATSLDPLLQPAAERIAREQLARISALHAQGEDPMPPRTDIAIVVLAADGRVLAMAGSGARIAGINHAIARNSPGSAGKPFVYCAALDFGVSHGQPFHAATLIVPTAASLAGPGGDSKTLRSHLRGPALPRQCLAVSDNHCVAEAAHAAGIPHTAAVVGKALHSHPEPYLGLVLGATAGSETSLLDLAAGYTAFLNAGLRRNPTATEPEPGERVFSPGTAFIVADLLRSVVDSPSGTAAPLCPFARANATPLMAKTGTAQKSDFWIAAAAPQFVVGIWVGDDEHHELHMSDGWSSRQIAVPAALAMLSEIARVRPGLLGGALTPPAGLRVHPVDPRRGCVDPSGQPEYFLPGREPQACESATPVPVPAKIAPYSQEDARKRGVLLRNPGGRLHSPDARRLAPRHVLPPPRPRTSRARR
jgi:membrane peptidoglycan carboxypeptidase